ncbi:MAG: hypothetical protein AVO33_03175 [delta proteobacterium ML8_F1]|nr:MAG: hypothetical protein AVO33_03175 [delta proteobacterium ML8_F1]
MILVLSMILSLSLIIIQSLLLGADPVQQVFFATRTIEAGETMGSHNTEKHIVARELPERFSYVREVEGLVAAQRLLPGEVILKASTAGKKDFYDKKETEYLVSLKMDEETTAAYHFEQGQWVDLIHVTENSPVPMKVFEEIFVQELIYEDPKAIYPQTLLLRVEEEVRNYILTHRREGRFEISP